MKRAIDLKEYEIVPMQYEGRLEPDGEVVKMNGTVQVCVLPDQRTACFRRVV